MSQSEFTLGNDPKPELVKGMCKCGFECDCTIKVFSNGMKHLWATCPKCGMTNAKQDRSKSIGLDDLKHRLMGIYTKIMAMTPGVDQDEAVCMIERLSEDLWNQIGKK